MRFPAKDEPLRWPLPNRTALGIGLALLAIHLVALNLPALGQQNATEDQVKAAYLLNFAKQAEWSRQALPDGSSPLVIGVSGGEQEFLDVLKTVVAGKNIGPHSVAIKAVSSEEEMKSCQIVFFRASERKHTAAAVETLARAGVLLVGEEESFLRQGGMINLVRDHGTIRFEINSDALDRSEIHFSSKILALAKAGAAPSRATASAAAEEGPRRVERNIPPEYPEIASRMKLTGTVHVEAVVRPDGTVKEVRILGGHPLLADSVARAVKQWKYQAAPKETEEIIKFTFGPQ